MQVPSMQELLEAGVHFGHQVRRWNPKMKPFIFGARDNVHVIDLVKTVEKLEEACEFVKKLGEAGGILVFAGGRPDGWSKRNAQFHCAFRLAVRLGNYCG